MSTPVRFCLALHNHQPIGNFDEVFEQAYQDSYLPFLELFEPYDQLCVSLHTSGPLLEWIDGHHPEYLDRVAALVSAGRIELLGGAFYEPILSMIPARDARGQIVSFRRWLEDRFDTQVRGMWLPERVWEQSMTRTLVDVGVEYTILDDTHFRNAGLQDDELHSYYLTEDDGRVLSIFPSTERSRYLIPFREVNEAIGYLYEVGQRHPGAVVVCGDDGEKFGIWPGTNKHCYHDGWLRRFFDALVENREWLKTTTLSDAIDNVSPAGRIYLPDSSYREMGQWALPADRQAELERLWHELDHDDRGRCIKPYLRGGFWRNFRVKYAEANEMYARMMMVSRRLEEIAEQGGEGQAIESARRELYRGQCNCSYWHGAFGGIYLPHLRNAVYNHLIAADNLIDQAIGRVGPRVELTAADFNFDAHQEVRLTNDNVVALVSPAYGGHLYELDVRSICHNLLATIARRPEAYHGKVLAGVHPQEGDVASIHDQIVFKQAGLDQRVHYDKHPRKSLVDHFFDADATPESIVRGEATELGDFVAGVYEFELHRSSNLVHVQLARHGNVQGHAVRVTKKLAVAAGSNELKVTYVVDGLPQDGPLHFGVEFNFAGLPAGAEDRYFYDADRKVLGQLGEQLDLAPVAGLGLIDEWLGIDVGISCNRPTRFWAFPISSVSQSEGGFEAVHQSVVVMPHWLIHGDQHGSWGVSITLSVDTSLADSRIAKPSSRDSLALPFVASGA